MQAILAATRWPAEGMGWDEIGLLAPGMVADLIAVSGDPLADIENIKQVKLIIRQGRVVPLALETPGQE